MFILSLRGPLGSRISAVFHAVMLISAAFLFWIQYFPVEILICAAVFIFYIRLIRFMRKHRALLQFNSPANQQWAFPSVQIARRTAFYVHLVMVIVGLLPEVMILVSNIPFQSGDAPDVGAWLGFWFFYYAGNLGLLGIINHTQQNAIRPDTKLN